MEEEAVMADLLIDGVTIHVECEGEGEPLVLVHGLGSPLVWQRVMEPLSKSFRVLAVDLPGFGRSGVPLRPYSTQEHADLVRHVLDALEITKTNILGVSYGGQIVSTIAAKYPGRVRRALLVCSSGLVIVGSFLTHPHIWNISSKVATSRVVNNVRFISSLSRLSFYDITRRPPDLAERFVQSMSERGRWEAWLDCARNVSGDAEDFAGRLAHVHAPTLILWGENDRITPVSAAHEFHKSILHSELKIFPHCGHSLPLEKPDEMVEAVTNFCIQR